MLVHVLRVVVNAIALWVCTLVVPGVVLGGSTASTRIGTLLVVALIFGVVNAVLKPVIHILGFPLYLLTLGLVSLLVNALLFLLVGWISGRIGLPFTVTGFGAAFLGALLVAVVAFLLHLLIPDRYE